MEKLYVIIPKRVKKPAKKFGNTITLGGGDKDNNL